MNSSKVIERLQQCLRLEYSIIVYFPRIADAVDDLPIKKMIMELGKASVDHAQVIATTIKNMGSDPLWSFEPFPEGKDIIKIFESQLEKERLAYELHKQTSEDIRDRFLKEKFLDIAKEETRHIKIVKDILLRLRKDVSPGSHQLADIRK